ncbi:MAG: hypothetical protein DLM70_01030 [Chloroflexi bacterium]|nr:MAG: hypothetical protein DLM70_01030 [Chloroflexota bacterium]
MKIKSIAVLSSAAALFAAGLFADTGATSAKSLGKSYFCQTHPKAAQCKGGGGRNGRGQGNGNGGRNGRNGNGNGTFPNTGFGGLANGGRISRLPTSGGGAPGTPMNGLFALLGAAGATGLGFAMRKRASK